MRFSAWRSVGRSGGRLGALAAAVMWGVAASGAAAQDDSGGGGEDEGASDVRAEAPADAHGKAATKVVRGRPEDPVLTIDWGFGASLPARRYVPVRLSLTGGIEAFSGVVVLRYRGDTTQTMSVTVPVAATPGKTSVYTPVIAYPGSGDKIEVVLAERSGKVVRRYVYASGPSDTEIQLPSVRADPDALIVTVGSPGSGATSATALRGVLLPGRVSSSVPVGLEVVSADGASLPTIAWGYESVRAVVVQSDAARTMDARAAAALREWVLQGGWLVVVAASGDESWSSWLPPGPMGDVIRVAGATDEAMAPALGRLVTTEVKLDRSTVTGRFPSPAPTRRRDAPYWMQGPTVAESLEKPRTPVEAAEPAGTPVDVVIEPAARITGRWMRLTPTGRRAGWTIGLTRRDPQAEWMGPPAADGGEDEGLLAQGPVGFGWVSVVGFDPRRASAMVSSKAAQRVWVEVFGLTRGERPAGAAAGRVLDAAPVPLVNAWGAWTHSSNSAVALVLDAVAAAEAPGRSVFLLVALAAGMVPLLIGPVDYFVLRRARLAHRSWLTALGWIALASVGAWLVPLSLRSSTTTVSRLNVVDVMMAPESAGDIEPLTVATGVTGVFAAGSIRATLTGLPERAVIRGLSGDMAWQYGSDGSTPAGDLPIAQASPGLDSAEPGADAWGGFARGRRETGSEAFGDRAQATTWRLWTFRAVEDRARLAGGVRAAIERDERGGVRVRVMGLPTGAEIRRGAVVTGGAWRELKAPAAAGSDAIGAIGVVLEAGASVERTVWEPRAAVREEYGYPYYDTKVGATLEETPGAALLMPGAQERGERLEGLVASGAWDVVYLHVTRLAPTVSLDAGSVNSEQAVYRIVIPRPAGTTAKDMAR